MDPSYPLLPLVNFLCAFLVLLPLRSLFTHWNTGVWMYAVWVSLSCLAHAVNAIVWRDNADVVAPVWCDISVRIFIGEAIAVPAASLTMTRRIFHIVHLRGSVASTYYEKRRATLFDLAIVLGLPLLNIVLSYIVQGHRFNIFEEVGCQPAIVNTAAGICPFTSIAPGYRLDFDGFIVRSYLERRKALNEMIASDPDVPYRRFCRVLALGCVDAALTVPCSAFLVWANATQVGPVVPWTGWVAVHAGFARIAQVPAAAWRGGPRAAATLRWNAWVSPCCALVLFVSSACRARRARTTRGLFACAGWCGGRRAEPRCRRW
ncbi:GPCR fungal pheromone mating factor [Phellopilus nigrolimitatus]|nr:GPCR fungal pheromone mating factor [Phellopilus nigrolimitatus]